MLLLGANSSALPWLVAPLGASAVLVFAVPASPLAQPWPLVAGNLVSAFFGLLLGQMIGTPLLSAGLAVGAAIASMSLARCLHPPGGACALLCALGATGKDAWGWPHLLAIGLNVFALGGFGWIYNNLTGHPWPHRAILPKPTQPAPGATYTHADIEVVLAEWNEVLDVDVDDLDAIFQAVQRRAHRRERNDT